MKLDEAKAECKRWLADCDKTKARALAMQALARERREGKITAEEAMIRLRAHDRASLCVYDGARLEQAVRLLLKHV